MQRPRAERLLPLVLVALVAAPAAAEQTIPGIGRVVPLGKLASGRGFLEGPALAPSGDVYFTDIPKNQILILRPSGEIDTFTDDSKHANGLMFNAAGEMVACEMDGQLVAWDVEQKTRRVLAAAYGGVRLNAPNDLVIDRQGGIYFTDPRFRAPQPLPQKVQGVYYLSVEGELARLVDDLPAPNGVLLSRDQKTLYVFPSDSPSMRAYDVKSPGEVSAGREFCRFAARDGRARGADGATIDEAGNLYITSGKGLEVVNPRGERLGFIEAPERPANATFVGNRLYVTARTSLYAFQLEVRGHRFAQPGEAP